MEALDRGHESNDTSIGRLHLDSIFRLATLDGTRIINQRQNRQIGLQIIRAGRQLTPFALSLVTLLAMQNQLWKTRTLWIST